MGGSIVQRLELEGWQVTWWTVGPGGDCRNTRRFPTRSISSYAIIRLPDVSGEAVFTELAKLPNTPPFMFVTGYGEIDQAVRLMRSGAVDFMTKPFAMDEFLRRIQAGRRTRAAVARRPLPRRVASNPAREAPLHRYAPATCRS